MKSGMRRLFGGGSVDEGRGRTSRSLAPLTRVLAKPPELSWPDYLHCLLEIAAEIEHSLMVEYLYAAYTLGGDEVLARHRKMVERWRSSLLTIAREEMGHLLTVQNLRCLLGAPINFEREDYPWDTPFYPFPFRLEPLCMPSLSCYVYAEMPAELESDSGSKRRLAPRYREFKDKDKARIVKEVSKVAHGAPHRVGTIYEQILQIIAEPSRIPDSCFNPLSLNRQASFDDWGRNHRPAPRYVDPEGSLLKPANSRVARVIVAQMSTRTEAIAALTDVAGQGEAPHLTAGNQEPSHFDRFLEIYQEFEQVDGWSPTLHVPANPTAGDVVDGQAAIEAEPARTWAHLFNVRYRMLLSYLAHTYRLAPSGRPDEPNLRGTVIHRAFGEMYNLKTIAGVLVTLPLTNGRNPKRAAPPFEMPYTLELPEREADCWWLHRDLLETSESLRTTLLRGATGDGARYLNTLGDIDRQAVEWTESVLAGLGVRKRHSA